RRARAHAARAARQARPGRPRHHRGLQARPASQARGVSRERRQAADPPRRPARGGDRLRCRVAADARAARLDRRHRGGHRYSAEPRGAPPAPARSRVMAHPPDDCFAFAGPLMPLAEMEQLIATRIAPVAETEEVALRDALGRVLARDVAAPLDLPPFDNSAVDGFAVRHRDLADRGETRLAIVDRVTAGAAAAPPLGAGRAVPLLTRAPAPGG